MHIDACIVELPLKLHNILTYSAITEIYCIFYLGIKKKTQNKQGKKKKNKQMNKGDSVEMRIRDAS